MGSDNSRVKLSMARKDRKDAKERRKYADCQTGPAEFTQVRGDGRTIHWVPETWTPQRGDDGSPAGRHPENCICVVFSFRFFRALPKSVYSSGRAFSWWPAWRKHCKRRSTSLNASKAAQRAAFFVGVNLS